MNLNYKETLEELKKIDSKLRDVMEMETDGSHVLFYSLRSARILLRDAITTLNLMIKAPSRNENGQ